MAFRAARIALYIALGLTLAAILAIALLPQVSRTERARRLVEAYISRSSGFDAAIGELHVGYDLTARVGRISLRAEGQEPFFVAESARLTLAPSLAGVVVRVEAVEPHIYADRFPAPAEIAEREREPSRRLDALWLPALDVDVQNGFVHQAGRTLGPIAISFAPDPASGLRRLSATTRIGGDANELSWSVDPDLAERRAAVEAEGTISDLPGLFRATALETSEAYTGKAKLRFEGEVRWDASGGGTATGKLAVSGVEGHDADSSRAVQGLVADADLEATLEPGKEPRVELRLSAAQGALLYDLFYVDLSEHPLRARFTGRRDGRSIRFDDVEAELAGMGKAAGNARYGADGSIGFDARIDVADLSSVYRVGIQDPFREMYPALADTAVDGRMHARLSYSGGAKPRITGRVEIENANLESKDPEVRVRDLAIDLPFLVRPAKSEARRQTGFVRASEVLLGGVPVEKIALDLVAEPDSIALAEPVGIDVFGGAMQIAHLVAGDLGGEGRSVRLGLALDGLDLRLLSQALGAPPFSGRISGAIPAVAIGGGRIATEGRIDVEAFEGRIAIRDLTVDQILSRVPELSLDADFEEVSLGRLTQELAVGKVTGIARGAVRDLVMAESQPVRFDAELETVSRSGVSQKISVTALRQLSILGGSDGDPISRGVLSLFDEYGYSKMGFRCALRNDRFELHGVESRDGSEYLVVGSRLPPSVNVVSHTQVISFSEMVRRLGRALQVGSASPTPSGEETERSEP